jgi:hypothetical protein
MFCAYFLLIWSINIVVCINAMDQVEIVDFSDLVIRDAFNGSYLALDNLKELAPRFPGGVHSI